MVQQELGLHRSSEMVKLVVGLHHRSSKVVELKVGLHHRWPNSEQEIS